MIAQHDQGNTACVWDSKQRKYNQVPVWENGNAKSAFEKLSTSYCKACRPPPILLYVTTEPENMVIKSGFRCSADCGKIEQCTVSFAAEEAAETVQHARRVCLQRRSSCMSPQTTMRTLDLADSTPIVARTVRHLQCFLDASSQQCCPG